MSTPSELLNNLIDVGTVANDGTGDDLREAFIKVNENFLYVGERLGAAVSGTNLGPTGEGVFKEVVNAQLRFKKIDADGNLRVRLVGDVITLDFRPNSTVDFQGQDITNVGSISSSGSVTANSFTGSLTGDVVGSLFADDSTLIVDGLTGQLYGSLHGNVVGDVTGNLTGNSTGTHTGPVIGPVTGPVTGDVKGSVFADDSTVIVNGVDGTLTGHLTGSIRGTSSDPYINVNELENGINIFDYGVINPVFTDKLSYLLFAMGTDMGTFNNPSEFGIDAGSI